MQENNDKRSRPLRQRGLAALRAGIVGAIDFVGGHSSLLLRLLTILVLLGTTTTLSARQATIIVAPPRIHPDQSVDLIVTSPTGLDLSTIPAEKVVLKPMDGISRLEVVFFNNELHVSFSAAGNIKLGPVQLILLGPGIRVLASAVFNVVDVGGDCPGHQNCCAIDPMTHLCTDCRNLSCPISNPCPSDQHCCENSKHCHCVLNSQHCQ